MVISVCLSVTQSLASLDGFQPNWHYISHLQELLYHQFIATRPLGYGRGKMVKSRCIIFFCQLPLRLSSILVQIFLLHLCEYFNHICSVPFLGALLLCSSTPAFGEKVGCEGWRGLRYLCWKVHNTSLIYLQHCWKGWKKQFAWNLFSGEESEKIIYIKNLF